MTGVQTCALPISLLVPRTTRRGALIACVATPAALLAAAALGALVDRARPFVAHPDVHRFITHAADSGFPSDHAAASFAIATSVVLFARRMGVVLLIAATLLAVSRVAVGVHYPTDVLAGAAIGVLAALAAAQVVPRLVPEWLLAAAAPVPARAPRGALTTR